MAEINDQDQLQGLLKRKYAKKQEQPVKKKPRFERLKDLLRNGNGLNSFSESDKPKK